MTEEAMKIKVCLIGDRAVGKTSLVRRYLKDEFSDDYRHTMGAKVYKTEILLPMELRHQTLQIDMTLWDVWGVAPLDEMSVGDYLNGVQGLLVVCDITRRSTADSLDEWRAATPQGHWDLPIHVIVNKSDLMNDVQVAEDEVFRLGETFSSPIMLTSAKTGANVQHAFESLAKSVVERELGPNTDFLVEERFGAIECHA